MLIIKHLALSLAVGLPCLAQPFGDDNQSGKWLPIPDQYEWPKVVDDAPSLRHTSHKLADIEKPLREIIEQYWEEGKTPASISIGRADLNADGKDELFLAIPYNGGTGGMFYEILTLSDKGSYENIGGIQGWGFKFLTPENDWLQIEGMSRGGGGYYSRYLLTYKDGSYQTTRNEEHDFNARKVTVRKN